MTAPLIWIGFPLIMGAILFLLRRWNTATTMIGTLTALFLAGIAWRFPIGEVSILGPWAFTIKEQLSFAGLQLVLSQADRPLLWMFFGAIAFFLAGASAAGVQRRFVPLSLMVAGLLSTVLAIEPFFYGALFIAAMALIGVLILVPFGQPINKGVIRFLFVQIVGVQFVLFGGRLMAEVAAASDDPTGVTQAALIFGIGFIFLFAIFPLYVWIPRILEDSHPYSAVFIFSMSFGITTIFFLEFLSRYPWLPGLVDVSTILRFVGILLVASGGTWAVFQRHLGRILGYAMVIEMGYALLSISVSDGDLYYAMLAPRMLALAVWGLGLSVLRTHSTDLRFKAIQGIARQFPVAGAGILLAQFSLAGLPLLAGFPILLALWQKLSLESVSSAVWPFLGSVGLVAGGLRSLAVLVMGPEDLPWSGKLSLISQILLVIGTLGLLILGLFPQWFYPFFSDLAGSFGFILP
jgi:NADH-quinone oxidoreductase subunit N